MFLSIFFSPSWGAVCCLRSLYLPFISDSLTLLAGRVSGRQSLSPGPVMFLQITEGLWSRRSLLIAEASDGARAICQIDGKVAEWGPRRPLLIRYFLPFYVSRSGVAWKPHLCNLNPAGSRLTRRPKGRRTNTNTPADGQRITGLRNYSLPVGISLRMPQLSSSPHGDLCLPSTFLMDRTSLSRGSFDAWAAGRIWLFVSRGDSRLVCLRLNQPAATAFKKLYNQGEFVPNWNFSNLLFFNIISVAVTFKWDIILIQFTKDFDNCYARSINTRSFKMKAVTDLPLEIQFFVLLVTFDKTKCVICFVAFLRWLKSSVCVQNTILGSPLMNSLNNLQMTKWWRM